MQASCSYKPHSSWDRVSLYYRACRRQADACKGPSGQCHRPALVPCPAAPSTSSAAPTPTARQQGGNYFNRRRSSRLRAADSGSSPSVPPQATAGVMIGLRAALHSLDVLYRFSRPHTMLGTATSIVSIFLLALGGAQPAGAAAGPSTVLLTPGALSGLASALSSALLMNVAIVGLNQLYDVDIDKVNKPYLPLASGELSLGAGQALVAACAAASLCIGLSVGSPALLTTLSVSLALGVVYSADVLPLMRWKKNPVLAAACILAVRAVLVQLGFFFHARWAAAAGGAAAALAITEAAAIPSAALGGSGGGGGGGGLPSLLSQAGICLTPGLLFTTSFMFLFSVVIALFKDIPDVQGDEGAGVRTFSVRLGVPRVFWTCITLLAAAYAGGVAYALLAMPFGPAQVAAALGHAALGALLLTTARNVPLSRRSSLNDYYMFIWRLFYAEYLLIPLLA